MVVIAITAILAAILLPVFARAREQARKSACLSNQKQVGLGLMMYLQDFDETYPMVYRNYSGGYWYQILKPYAKSSQVFICPTAGVIESSAGMRRSGGNYVFAGGHAKFIQYGRAVDSRMFNVDKTRPEGVAQP